MRKTTGSREEDGDWVDGQVRMCSLEGGPVEEEPPEERPFKGLRTFGWTGLARSKDEQLCACAVAPHRDQAPLSGSFSPQPRTFPVL